MPIAQQPSLFPRPAAAPAPRDLEDLTDELSAFHQFGTPTVVSTVEVPLPDRAPIRVPLYLNEFWTARQRAAHSLHEISYRACFKPQLARFFIERLTAPGQTVYDPFMGRGTTVLEAALLGRRPAGCDINPLSVVMVEPRLAPCTARQVAGRLHEIDLDDDGDGNGGAAPPELLAFYHPETLRAIGALRKFLVTREREGHLDGVDRWIRMVALNRLTGHSPGFFSVYTMPPNQAVSAGSQRKINARRRQTPPRRDVPGIILKKTRALLADCDPGCAARLAATAILLAGDADQTPEMPDGGVQLVVTSPPFLDVVDYATDNWLRCWFIASDPTAVAAGIFRKLEDWQAKMARVFAELRRLLVPGGHVAFEVGEVKRGRVRLEEAAIRAAVAAGLEPRLVLINCQRFTKTANCWGVSNNRKGTNTNRVVLLQRPPG